MSFEKEVKSLLMAYLDEHSQDDLLDQEIILRSSKLLFPSQFLIEVRLEDFRIIFQNNADCLLQFNNKDLVELELSNILADSVSIENVKNIVESVLNDIESPNFVEFRCELIFKTNSPNSLRTFSQIIPFRKQNGHITTILILAVALGSQRYLINDTTISKLEVVDGYVKEKVNINSTSNKEIFTVRELQVLNLLGKGLSSKNIASKLFISINTVNNHRANLLDKANCQNTVQLLAFANRIGLI